VIRLQQLLALSMRIKINLPGHLINIAHDLLSLIKQALPLINLLVMVADLVFNLQHLLLIYQFIFLLLLNRCLKQLRIVDVVFRV